MKLKITKFDPATMLKPHRIILFVGRRGSGKSTVQRDIMMHISSKVDFGLAMTPTEETMGMFRKHMPDNWIYPGFNAAKLDSMLSLQRELGKQGKMRNLFILMDDCMYDKKVMKGTGIRDLFMNGRHVKVTFMNAMQYIMDMGPDLRTQVDYVFAMKENIIANKSKLHKYFFGMFDKFDDFSRVMDRCTENFGCIVLDNTAPTGRLEDSVFWYKATLDLPPFKMGKPLYWKLAAQLQKSEEEMLEDDRTREFERRSAYMSDKKNSRITVVERQDEHGNSVEDALTLVVN